MRTRPIHRPVRASQRSATETLDLQAYAREVARIALRVVEREQQAAAAPPVRGQDAA